jgi:hypothetical protein
MSRCEREGEEKTMAQTAAARGAKTINSVFVIRRRLNEFQVLNEFNGKFVSEVENGPRAQLSRPKRE